MLQKGDLQMFYLDHLHVGDLQGSSQLLEQKDANQVNVSVLLLLGLFLAQDLYLLNHKLRVLVEKLVGGFLKEVVL
jgi:hypothetical protein